MLDIDFITLEEGIKKLKSAVGVRNQMGGALYWNICNDDCWKLAFKLISAGADKAFVLSIGGWEEEP